MHRLYKNTTSFYTRDLSIHRFLYPHVVWGCLGTNSMSAVLRDGCMQLDIHHNTLSFWLWGILFEWPRGQSHVISTLSQVTLYIWKVKK